MSVSFKADDPAAEAGERLQEAAARYVEECAKLDPRRLWQAAYYRHVPEGEIHADFCALLLFGQGADAALALAVKAVEDAALAALLDGGRIS